VQKVGGKVFSASYRFTEGMHPTLFGIWT